MTVPLVDEFSACTSTYGTVAPTPPDAAAHAGSAAMTARLAATSAPQAGGPPAPAAPAGSPAMTARLAATSAPQAGSTPTRALPLKDLIYRNMRCSLSTGG